QGQFEVSMTYDTLGQAIESAVHSKKACTAKDAGSLDVATITGLIAEGSATMDFLAHKVGEMPREEQWKAGYPAEYYVLLLMHLASQETDIHKRNEILQAATKYFQKDITGKGE